MARFGLNEVGFDHEEDRRRAAAGAQALERIHEQNIIAHHQARSDFYENLHAQIEQAKWEREQAAATALAQRKVEFEKEAATALPELLAIKPGDPDAEIKHAEWGVKHGHLLDPERGVPSALGEYNIVGRLIESRSKQNESLQSKKDAKAAADADRAAFLASKKADIDALRADKEAAVKAVTGPGGMTPESATFDGVTYKNPKSVSGQKENHEKEKDYAGKQMDAIAKTSPDWLNTTGLYTDEKGVQRFGYADKEKDDATTVAKPDQIRQYQQYQSLKGDYDLHDKALSDLRKAELAGAAPAKAPPAAGDAATANPNLPPSPAGDATPPAAAAQAAPDAPHPYEGKRVLQKSTGQYGTFTNGQFVPETAPEDTTEGE